MSCLEITDKIGLMLEQLALIKEMLAEDGIRPVQQRRLEEEYNIVKRDIRDMYFDMYKVIRN